MGGRGATSVCSGCLLMHAVSHGRLYGPNLVKSRLSLNRHKLPL